MAWYPLLHNEHFAVNCCYALSSNWSDGVSESYGIQQGWFEEKVDNIGRHHWYCVFFATAYTPGGGLAKLWHQNDAKKYMRFSEEIYSTTTLTASRVRTPPKERARFTWLRPWNWKKKRRPKPGWCQHYLHKLWHLGLYKNCSNTIPGKNSGLILLRIVSGRRDIFNSAIYIILFLSFSSSPSNRSDELTSERTDGRRRETRLRRRSEVRFVYHSKIILMICVHADQWSVHMSSLLSLVCPRNSVFLATSLVYDIFTIHIKCNGWLRPPYLMFINRSEAYTDGEDF